MSKLRYNVFLSITIRTSSKIVYHLKKQSGKTTVEINL